MVLEVTQFGASARLLMALVLNCFLEDLLDNLFDEDHCKESRRMGALKWLFSKAVVTAGLTAFALGITSAEVRASEPCDDLVKRLTLREWVVTNADKIRDKVEVAVSKNDPWTFTSEEEKTLSSIWDDAQLADSEKLENLFRSITKTRLDNSNPVTRFFMRGVLRGIVRQRSLFNFTIGPVLGVFMGTHYNPVFNRIVMTNEKVNPLAKSFLQIHEVEHAFHRNTNPLAFLAWANIFPIELFMVFRTPIIPILTRHIEAKAIGAQWELVQRIPKEKRVELADQLRSESTPEGKATQDLQRIVQSGLYSKGKELLRLVLGKQQLEDSDIELLTNALVSDPVDIKRRKEILVKSKSTLTEKGDQELFSALLLSGIKNQTILNWMLGHLGDSDVAGADIEVLPQAVNDRLISYLINTNKGSLETLTAKIFEECLRNAELPKEDFVQKIAPLHGYSLAKMLKSHHGFSHYKLFLLISSMTGAYAAYAANVADPQLVANDLTLLYKLLFFVFGLPG